MNNKLVPINLHLCILPLLFVLFLLGCTEEEVIVQAANTSISPSGVISGKISNYSYSTSAIDSIYAHVTDSSFVGRTALTTDGTFSFKLNAIPLLTKITTTSGVSVSNKSALTGGAYLMIHTNNYVHSLMRLNYKTSDYGVLLVAGHTYFEFADRPVTIKGTNSSVANGITIKVIYDLNFHSGWNEVYETQNFNSETAGIDLTYTTTLPSDLEWVSY